MSDDLTESLIEAGTEFLGSRTAAERYVPSVKKAIATKIAAAGKECDVDHAFLPLTEFGEDPTRYDGLQRVCRYHAAEQSAYYRANRY